MIASIAGSDLEVLFQTGVPSQVLQSSNPLNWPIGLALDISRRMIYWTQKGPSKGNQGRLFRASLEIPAGRSVSQRTDIQCLLSGLPEPIDLDFDAHTRMLYWTDRGNPPLGGTLNRICIDEFGEFEGSGMEMGIGTRQTKTAEARHVVMRKLNEPIGLKLDRRIGHVYVADMSGCIYRCDKDGAQRRTVLAVGEYGAFTGITISHACSSGQTMKAVL